MNGIHDCGGMDGMGPIVVEPDEPVFHEDWERRVCAMLIGVGPQAVFNIDELRHAIERMGNGAYLQTSYYEHWLHCLETLLVENRALSAGELHQARAGRKIARVPAATPVTAEAVREMLRIGGDCRVHEDLPTRFAPGQHVRARNLNPHGHTRLPRYVRSHAGTVETDHGVFVYPDTSAHRLGRKPQHLFSVRFSGEELWGENAEPRSSVSLDLFEDYLEPV